LSFSKTFEAHIQDALVVAEKDLQQIPMPTGIYAQEAVNLVEWATSDKNALLAAKLDWTIVESITPYAAVLMDAESRWQSQRFEKAEAQKQWAELSPEAYELRNEILHAFYYAFRETPEVYARVQDLAQNTGDEDMILDLNTEFHIGENNKELLAAIGFDMAKLDKAAETAEQMQKLLAQARGLTPAYNETKRVRDQAYTLLKKSVDKVRACGQYVFYRNPDRYCGYSSNYLRTHRSKKSEQTTETVSSTQAVNN